MSLDFPKRPARQLPWFREEDSAMIQFVSLHKDLQEIDREWPSLRVSHPYWEEPNTFLTKSCGTSTTGKTTNIICLLC